MDPSRRLLVGLLVLLPLVTVPTQGWRAVRPAKTLVQELDEALLAVSANKNYSMIATYKAQIRSLALAQNAKGLTLLFPNNKATGAALVDPKMIGAGVPKVMKYHGIPVHYTEATLKTLAPKFKLTTGSGGVILKLSAKNKLPIVLQSPARTTVKATVIAKLYTKGAKVTAFGVDALLLPP